MKNIESMSLNYFCVIVWLFIYRCGRVRRMHCFRWWWWSWCGFQLETTCYQAGTTWAPEFNFFWWGRHIFTFSLHYINRRAEIRSKSDWSDAHVSFDNLNINLVKLWRAYFAFLNCDHSSNQLTVGSILNFCLKYLSEICTLNGLHCSHHCPFFSVFCVELCKALLIAKPWEINKILLRTNKNNMHAVRQINRAQIT